MAMTTKQLRNFSWMSQASYLDFTGIGVATPAATILDRLGNSPINPDKNFALEQARDFLGLNSPSDSAAGFSYQADKPNDSVGFSATVFKSNDSNEYTVAVRGIS